MDDTIQVQSIPVEFAIQSPFSDHDNGNVTLTVTDFGALGYWDYRNNQDVGSSFIYGDDNPPALYHGSLLLAAPPDRVSDCAYGDSSMSRFDFVTTGNGIAMQHLPGGLLEGYAEFNDDNAERPLYVTVRQRSYSFAEPPDDDYVMLSYTIINDGAPIDSLYVGLFLDWDVVQAEMNSLHWNGDAGVGWMEFYQPNWPLYGTGLVDAEASFQAAVGSSEAVSYGSRAWHDQSKMNRMLTGFELANTPEWDDWVQLIGAGPFNLGYQDSTVVTFAVLAGDDENDLIANIDAARSKWNTIAQTFSDRVVVEGFRLVSVYPSPFNSSVNIAFDSEFSGVLSWSILDLQGRIMMSGVNTHIHAGRHILPIKAGDIPSGFYMMRMLLDDKSLVVPVTLVK
jgi:hypothetical protein